MWLTIIDWLRAGSEDESSPSKGRELKMLPRIDK